MGRGSRVTSSSLVADMGKLDFVCLVHLPGPPAEWGGFSWLLVLVLLQDGAVVLNLIHTIDTVMGHISYNLHASTPQVTMEGSSAVAGSCRL